MQNSLIDLFNEYFKVVPADTPERLLQSYRLRYEVYCKEALIPGFHPNDYPEGLEYDQYDDQSAHSLLIHKPSGLIAGTVRLILAARRNQDEKLPLEKIAGDAFYTDSISFENLPRSHLSEISRLILAPEFRVRKGEDRQPQGLVENTKYPSQHNGRSETNVSWKNHELRENLQRRKFPHTILGLFVAIVRMSIEHSLTYWYGGMEPVCARLLRVFGIGFTPISPIVDYYGPCRSYLGYIPDIMEGIYWTNPSVWALLTDNGALFPHPKYPSTSP